MIMRAVMPLTSLPIWHALQAHYQAIRHEHLRDWFDASRDVAPTRAERFTFEGAGITLDASKNRITNHTLELLCELARQTGVETQRAALFQGGIVNATEGLAALHTALRTDPVPTASIAHTYDAMKRCAQQIREGKWVGATGKPIQHIVQLGIGGSHLGPKMVCDALQQFGLPSLTLHFVSNMDGVDLQRVLDKIDPETTLALVVSKTFQTQETLMNARSLRHWLEGKLAAHPHFQRSTTPEHKQALERALQRHWIGISANRQAALDFGILKENFFEMPQEVGGRYSLWSAVGLGILIFLGPTHFEALLAGARQMDEHFLHTPLECNLPVLLALLSIWYRNFFGAQTHLVAPYAQALADFPSYLQQLEMESLGKSACVGNGAFVDYDTSAVIWGAAGTNGQHAFFQMVHQGTTLIPTDFIALLTPGHNLAEHHTKLLANCFAQSAALMRGQSQEDLYEIWGSSQKASDPHRIFPGNHPSNTLLLDALNPHTLGALIALYEHKVFVQATIWDINPFDQFGVELGKTLGMNIEAQLKATTAQSKQKTKTTASLDSSTQTLIARAKAHASL